MALVKSPIISQISGKIADINFRTLKSGKVELAATRDPTTAPRTEDQKTVNETYAAAVQTWRTKPIIYKMSPRTADPHPKPTNHKHKR
jgi:hypothetical protein